MTRRRTPWNRSWTRLLLKKNWLHHHHVVGLSTEDRIFREDMERNFRKISDGNWQAPLPFKSQRPRLPKNRSMALDIAKRFNVSSQRNQLNRTILLISCRNFLIISMSRKHHLFTRKKKYGIYQSSVYITFTR